MPLIAHIAVLCLAAWFFFAILKLLFSLFTTLNFFDCFDFADMGGGGASSTDEAKQKERQRQRQIESEAYQRYLEEMQKFITSEYLMASALAANEMMLRKEQIHAFDESKEKELVKSIKESAENKDKIHSSIDPLTKNLGHVMSTSLEDKGLKASGLTIWIDPELLMLREYKSVNETQFLSIG